MVMVVMVVVVVMVVAAVRRVPRGTAAASRLYGFRPRARADLRAVLRSFGIGDILWRPLADIPAP
jgi:hypothetical protein